MSNPGLRTRLSALLAVFVLSTLSFAVTADRIPGAITSGNGVILQKSLHPQAQSKFDQGQVEPSFQLGYMTLLTQPSPAQQKALTKLLAEQQDRSSRNYHKWLTPAQYGEQFGLSQPDMDRITGWLKSQGFTIKRIGATRNLIVFSGTAAHVQSAFKTEIHHYNVNGQERFANSSPLTIPSELNGIVTGIVGTHNFLMHSASTGNRLMGPKMRPSYFDGFPVFPNVLSPSDIAVMYDINGLYNTTPAIDGTGEKIAIVGQTDIFLEDVNDFRSGFGLAQINSDNCTTDTTSGLIDSCSDPLFKYVLVGSEPNPRQPDSLSDDLPEADLDIEWSGAVAPGAQIVYINSPEGNGVIDSLLFAITTSPIPATVVSMSYGECEFNNTLNVESQLTAALAEGITIVNSSGDSGSAACDRNPPNGAPPFTGAVGGQGVSYPASSPSVVAVGGTAITLANDSYPNPSSFWQTSNGTDGLSLNSNIPEIPWSDDEAFSQFCLSITNPSQNGFCNPPSQTPPAPGVLINSPQTAQEDLWISAGGGGASNCFSASGTGVCQGLAQPAYQSGLSLQITSTNQVPSPVTRWLPDVSFLASPNFPGYITCTQQFELNGDLGSGSACAPGGATGISNNLGLNTPSIFGGTSVSTPVFAGMLALMNQSLGTQGLGDIHQTLYSLAAANSTTPNGAFNQVTTGDNYTYCSEGQPVTTPAQPASVVCPSSGANPGRIGFSATDFDATAGFNLVTGLGSVNASHLAAAWSASLEFSLNFPTSTFQLTAGESASVTANLTLLNGFTGTVTFSCPSPGSEITCTAPPATNTTGQVAFMVQTTAPTTGALRRPLDRGSRVLYAALLPGILGILILGFSKRSQRSMRLVAMIMVLGLSTAWLSSCGGSNNSSSSNPGTPPGTYTVKVTATSSLASVTNSFQITVQ